MAGMVAPSSTSGGRARESAIIGASRFRAPLLSLAKPPRIPSAIWALGFVSLFTDLGSELVHSLLPVLLAGTLGASALTIGLIEGAAEALALGVKVFSGYLSDAAGRRKPLVLLGYGLAAAVKPLFPLAGSVGTVATARLLDRVGKGIRGAPRDALVSEIAPVEIRGASFGLRQSMDTVGAVLGPLAAIGLMGWFGGDIRTVLWFAVLPGLVSVLLLVLAVREPAAADGPRARLPIDREGLARLGDAYWRVVAVGALLSLVRFSEAFLVLRASERGLSNTLVPLVLVTMSLTYTLTAYPAGRLSDRLPRRGVLAASLGALALADGVLAFAATPLAVLAGVACWGVHMGLSQGVLASLVADSTRPAYRGTAFGVFNLVSGLGLLLASAVAGALWDRFGAAAPFAVAAPLALLTATAALRWLPAGHCHRDS